MQYFPFYQTHNNHEEKMLGRKIRESAEEHVKHNSRKVKRYRSAFTTGQINYLEKQFRQCPYIGNAIRKEVANALNIPERAIKIWFQNRRMKEKKEVINKEYNLDRSNNSINNDELTNDTFINVRSLQSVNDRQFSLQSAVLGNTECKNNIKENNKLNVQRREKPENVKVHKLNNLNLVSSNRHLKNNGQQDFSTGSRNMSKCNSSKIYDNKNFMKYLDNNNADGTNTNKSAPKVETKFEEHSKKSSTAPVCQDLPEDLSARSKPNVIFSQDHLGTSKLETAFIPFCNMQNYFTPTVSEGGIIWKPVNLMPLVAPNLPFAMPESHINRISQLNMQKSCCNCNCHFKNNLNFDKDMTDSRPKYVIAVPYN